MDNDYMKFQKFLTNVIAPSKRKLIPASFELKFKKITLVLQ